MMDSLPDHIAALLVHMARQRNGVLSAFADDLPREIANIYGLDVSAKLIDDAYAKLENAGVVRKLRSDLAGDLLQISVDNVLRYFGPQAAVPSRETTVEYDHAYTQAHNNLAILDAYAYGGQPWIDRVVARLKSGRFEAVSAVNEQADGVAVPAADRIVSLGHNQVQLIEDAIEAVSADLERENAIDGDDTLRQRFLGQLAAGRELVRAESVRAYLVYETLVKLLGTLIERYKDKALGAAAQKLLDALIDHILGK